MTESIDAEPTAPGEQKKPEKSAYEKLKPRFRRFVDLHIDGKTGVEIGRLLGFGGNEPRIWASKIKGREDVQAAIAEREAEAMQEAGISLTRSWIEVRRIAYFDPAKLVGENGDNLQLHQLDEDTRAAISGVEVEELYDGEGRNRVRIGDVKKYRLASKLDANKLILQRRGELVDKHEFAGPGGKELNTAPPLIQIVRYPAESKAEGNAGTDSAPAE